MQQIYILTKEDVERIARNEIKKVLGDHIKAVEFIRKIEHVQRVEHVWPPANNEQLKQLLNTKISDWYSFSIRVTRILELANFITVGQLVIKRESEMLKYRNLGHSALNEIRAALGRDGLSFGMLLPSGILE